MKQHVTVYEAAVRYEQSIRKEVFDGGENPLLNGLDRQGL